ncbi:MAG: 50S ribosomal protein L25 [Bacteroidales bacterium]|jgi:large subunit ribosomal protein L25|nr:50S ribosomal protein L25 [Bacteroidales bacterium]
MKHIELKGQVREAGNKAAIKAVRRAGQVPCNIYGLGLENILFTIDAQDLKTITHTPNSYIIDLHLSDGRNGFAVIHEVQYHPVTDEPLHVDFLFVTEDKPVTIEVPVLVTGHAEGVKMGGKLLVSSRKLRVSAMMDKLPDLLEVDSTPLKIGKQIVAGDLNYDGVTIVSPKATIICSVRPTRATQQAKMEAQQAGKKK